MRKTTRPRPAVHASSDPERVRAEIAYMESRLEEIGFEGDCGYERAMIKLFEEQIVQRRAWLAGC